MRPARMPIGPGPRLRPPGGAVAPRHTLRPRAMPHDGMPAYHAIHTERQNAVCTAIYEDLGLARAPAIERGPGEAAQPA